VVAPGANPAQIQLVYEGINQLEINNNQLIIQTSVNKIIEQRPYAYQLIDERKEIVPCNIN